MSTTTPSPDDVDDLEDRSLQVQVREKTFEYLDNPARATVSPKRVSELVPADVTTQQVNPHLVSLHKDGVLERFRATHTYRYHFPDETVEVKR